MAKNSNRPIQTVEELRERYEVILGEGDPDTYTCPRCGGGMSLTTIGIGGTFGYATDEKNGTRYGTMIGAQRFRCGYCATCDGPRFALRAYKALPAFDRELIEAAFPSRDFSDLETWRTPNLKSPDRLAIAARQAALKSDPALVDACGRCGGCGRYSYNQLDGDRCYGCNGTGREFVKPTTKAIKAQYIAAAKAFAARKAE